MSTLDANEMSSAVHQASKRQKAPWVGTAVPRREDRALLTGQARFIDDLEPVAGLRHAAILRSPHPHARIRSVDASRALAMPGIIGVVTGREIAELINPIPSVIKTPMTYFPCAVDKVRYVGEPVAVVVAESRYRAEDAAELIEVDYEPLPAVVDPVRAMAEGAPILHEQVGSNVVSRRTFRYGDPDAAFARAVRVFELDYVFPRYSSMPLETYGVIAHYEAFPDRFTAWSNFQGPFVLHPLMAASLKVPGSRLRLITPPASGGSFGIKQAVFSYIVLLAAVSRKLGVPIKWIEDRAEHLMASSSSSDRAGKIAAAFAAEGDLIGLRFSNIANMGAYVRPPEPASVYRMHSASNGAYRVADIAIENALVVTNQVPCGLNRGYGGPQFYFALERIMDIAARGMGMDPGELRRRNFVPSDAFPYHCVGGSILDAGDYVASLDELLRLASYEALRAKREEARRSGRLYGIGFAAGTEPSGSNMAYVTLAQTPEERAKSGPKSGANASAVISIDPTGQVTLRLCSTPNGQGHSTVAAQIIADVLGLDPGSIDVVTEIDTLTSAWSIASGNYSNRFSAIVAGAVTECANRVADKLKLMAGNLLEVAAEDIELIAGHARIVGVPEKAIPVRRLAAGAHWHAAGMPAGTSPGIYETTVISPSSLQPPDAEDRVASAVTYGFVIDVVAVEIERTTGRLHIDKYVSVHDVGNQLNPLIVEGQIHGGFAHGLGAALMEELAYDDLGHFVSGTFADYLCIRATEMPPLTVGHVTTPSPTNPLGVKGMGDGSSMLAPAAIANAVADALGREDITLPLTPQRLWSLANGGAPGSAAALPRDGLSIAAGPGVLAGEGEVILSAPPDEVWRRLIDANELAAVIPGCCSLIPDGPDRYCAEVSLGVGAIRGLYAATIEIKDKRPPDQMRLVGAAKGVLGFGSGEGLVTLKPHGTGGTRLSYRYRARVGGKVASVGQRMLGTVTRMLIGQFFKAFDSRNTSAHRQGLLAWISRLLATLGGTDR